jgi:hypothetical protein
VARIALVRKAAAELDLAERATNNPRTVAVVRCHHGNILEVWGFPLDAYGWYRAALNADPECTEAIVGIYRISALLHGGSSHP